MSEALRIFRSNEPCNRAKAAEVARAGWRRLPWRARLVIALYRQWRGLGTLPFFGRRIAWAHVRLLDRVLEAAGDVYDGDTIEIEGQRARLYGIDAFELSQTCLDARGRPWRCGIAAKAALAERIEGQALQCVVLDEDRDGWYVSRCVGEDGTDLGAYVVRAGLALADKNDYLADEADARRRRAGAWEGQFMPPGSGARTAADARFAPPWWYRGSVAMTGQMQDQARRVWQ